MGEAHELTSRIRQLAQPLDSRPDQYHGIMELVGDAEIVMLGEASHGTHEFYNIRADITRQLIEEKGFSAVAVEGDWPDCYRLNRYVRGFGNDRDARSALADFKRFPMWMWRNTVVEEFIAWLRMYNEGRPFYRQAGFYGLDMYSLYASTKAVIDYLDKVDPRAAAEARKRYGCFDHFDHLSGDGQRYGYDVRFGLRKDCEDEAVEQLLELFYAGEEYLFRDGVPAEEERFSVEQNARVVKSAESYFRNMFSEHVNLWNLRDEHMVDTLTELRAHLSSQPARPAKIVVWAHNSHLGDARATEMGRYGEINVGQLTRQRYGEQVRLIGFTTYRGTVSAATDWDAPVEQIHVRPGLNGSYEKLLHEVGIPAFFLPLRGQDYPPELERQRLERAIGVIYQPQTERQSHYFQASLPSQFDGVIHIDESRALEPLDRTSEQEHREPETYPYGV